MRIAVVGVGAMGSIYAGRLADAGNEVWGADPWRAHMEAIRTRGLRVSGPAGELVSKEVRAVASPADAPPCDLYVIATKVHAAARAAESVCAAMRPNSLILTIQNGLGAADRVAPHLPLGNIALGVAEGFGASMREPGHAHHNAMNLIRFGEIAGGPSARLERLARVWREAGFRVQVFEDIDRLIWEKFVCNVAFSAPCAAFDRTIGEVMGDPALWRVALGCAREAFDLGRRMGIAFSFPDPDAYVSSFGARMPDARPSLALDHRARRPSEIDAINGMASELGRRLEVATPYNDAVAAVVRARESDFARDPV